MSYRPIAAHSPWETFGSVEEEPKEPAPRREVTFRCDNNHPQALVFAADAQVPDTWECPRCGLVARRDGAPDGPLTRPVLPGYNTNGSGTYDRDASGTTPMAQLLKRLAERPPGSGERLLAERLAEIRGNRNG